MSAVLHASGRTAAEVTRALADLAHQVEAALPDLPLRQRPHGTVLGLARSSTAARACSITGYTGRYATRLTLADFFGLSDLVVALAGLPGAQVDGPSWSLRRGSPLHQEARVDAVRAAVARARDYAAALGATLGDLLELSDTDGGMGGASPHVRHAPRGRPIQHRSSTSNPSRRPSRPRSRPGSP